jgi:hypothetical protein
MTTMRKKIAALLSAEPAPGLDATAISKRMRISKGAALGQIKELRKTWVVQTTADATDSRVKHYRITGRKPNTPEEPAQEPKPATPAPKPALSAVEVEALICETIDKRKNAPMRIGHLGAATGLPQTMLRPALILLVQRGTLQSKDAGYSRPAAHLKAAEHVAKPRQVDVMAGIYTGTELRPFDGRPGAMAAYALPSRGMQA